MNKLDKFDSEMFDIALFAKAVSNPARLAILKYLAQTKSCISGDISDFLPLSRTTVSQHLKVLRDSGLIKGEIDGPRINYCLNGTKIERFLKMTENFFAQVRSDEAVCTDC
ncbi:MAG: metalloregulator ArsR/SmtB family transcription factor [Bacteroidales bacterium]|nr:metalloregulator ArsR/SmtB family transcription factor [Bacteroidales bacterium]